MHSLKRFFQKIWIRSWKVLNATGGEFTEVERDAINICRKLLIKEDSVLLMSPISLKRYIKSDDGNIFIIISDRKIDIVNHAYSYTIQVGDKGLGKIKYIFDNEIERRRVDMEIEIKSNIKHSLQNIYQNLIKEDESGL